MKTKVLFIISTLERGGPTNIIFSIVNNIDRTLIEPCILTLSPEPKNSRKDDFLNIGVKVYTLERNRLYWLLSDLDDLKKLIREINPHVVHSHSLRADVSSAKHLGDYYRISTIHADLTANYQNTYGRIIGNYFVRKQLHHVAQLESAVACSFSVFKLYKNRIAGLKCIPNGIERNVYSQVSSAEKAAIRKSLGLSLDKKIFVSVGSLCSRKDPITIIKGFSQSIANDNSDLVFLGTGELESELTNIAASHPNVLLKGFVNNVSDYVKSADYFISASHSEGLPNTVLEALSCGLPVCLSDIGPHQEILEIDKRAGLTFEVGNASGLASSITTVLNSPYEPAADAAVRIIASQLNSGRMANQYQELYLSQTKVRVGD